MTPKKKVVAGGIGGAVATLIVWAANTFAGVEVSPEAAGSLATVLGFALAYFKAE